MNRFPAIIKDIKRKVSQSQLQNHSSTQSFERTSGTDMAEKRNPFMFTDGGVKIRKLTIKMDSNTALDTISKDDLRATDQGFLVEKQPLAEQSN